MNTSSSYFPCPTLSYLTQLCLGSTCASTLATGLLLASTATSGRSLRAPWAGTRRRTTTRSGRGRRGRSRWRKCRDGCTMFLDPWVPQVNLCLGRGNHQTWFAVQISNTKCKETCPGNIFESWPQVSSTQQHQQQQQQDPLQQQQQQQHAVLHAGQIVQVGQVIQSGDVKLTIVPGDVKVITAPAGQVVQGGGGYSIQHWGCLAEKVK